MTLCDANPIYALVTKRQAALRSKCEVTLKAIQLPMITTWICFAEAMYLAGKEGGWPLQKLVWGYVEQEIIAFHDLSEIEWIRMIELMERYRDVPMDLADASLVAVAETLKINRIFTLDSDFYSYRMYKNQTFEIMP